MVAQRLGSLGKVVGATTRRLRSVSWFDTARWRDPAGRQLLDRVWLARTSARHGIDTMLKAAIANGEDPLLTARKLEQYLSPSWAPRRDATGKLIANQPKRLVTRTPRSGAGSYAARRLARTEISRAHGLATIESARLNPFVRGVQWILSSSYDPRRDAGVCADNADEDSGLGRGVYEDDAVPDYPAHPNERCHLETVPIDDPDAVVQELRAEYAESDDPDTEHGDSAPDTLVAFPDRRRGPGALIAGLFLAFRVLTGGKAA